MFTSKLIGERSNRRFPVGNRQHCQGHAKVSPTGSLWLLLLLCFSTLAGADNIVSRPVGFVRIATPPNKSVLTSIPFYAFKNSIDEVLKGQLTGATNEALADHVIKWDPQLQGYESAFKAAGTTNPLIDGQWFRNDVDWVTSSLSLNPGEAFWIENRQAMTQSVLLAGFVVLDATNSVMLYPALNLFSYPFSSKIVLNSSQLAEDGAIGAAVMTNADRVTDNVLNRTFWLLHDTNSPPDGKWLNEDSLVANEELLLGRGYWYNRVDAGGFSWNESRPYANMFPADERPPVVTAMTLGSDGSEVTLTIATYGSSGEMLEIYYQDVSPTGSLDTVNGWILAAKDISSTGHTSVQWVDDGTGGRGRVDSVFARFYLVGRGDIDSDGDKLPDSRERFVYGTSAAQSDTDGDGSPDGWEIEQGLDPLNGKDGVKGVSDQLASKELMGVTAMEQEVGGGTIGNTGEGTFTDNIWDNGAWINACRFTAATNMQVNVMYAKVVAIAGHYQGAIYSDNYRFLRGTTEVNNPTNGWNVFPLTSPQVLTNGNSYWLAIWSDDANARVYAQVGGTIGWRQYNYGYGAWPDPLNLSGSGSSTYSIYATGPTVPTLAILTSTNAVTVPEGGTANFQVKLSSAPVSYTTVTVGRVSGDMDISVQSGTSLMFSASNWNTNQTVTLEAVADVDWTNGSATIQCSAPGLTATDVIATERDSTPLPLTITTTSLPNGISNVAYSATLMASGGTAPYSWSVAGGSLPPGIMLSNVGILSGTPTTTGIFNFTGRVSDAGSPGQTTNKSLSIAIVTAPTAVTIWPTSAAPIVVDGGADSPVELGVKFRSDVNGTITGIRFYKATANTGAHVGNLWTSTGTNLATVTFSNETASGWQQAFFATPVAITSNTVYVASYHANSGHYSADDYYFQGKGMDSPPLHALATGVSGDNGVYVYGASSLFPNQTYNAANYWVDVVFQAGPPPTLTSLSVTPVNPRILTGASQQFTATGTYSDSSAQNLSSQVTWTSLNTGVATINTSGLATGVSTGMTIISATLAGVSNNTTLTVQAPPTLTSLTVTPANPSIWRGASQQFTATGIYSDGSTQNLSSQVTWTSSNTGVATINVGGLATGSSAGNTTISATLGGLVGSTTLTVLSVPLTITTTSLPNGISNVAYSATLTASGGTAPYSWSVAGGSLPLGITLSSGGILTGTPTTTGIFNFTGRVSDAGSPGQTTNKSLSIAIVTAPTAVTIWPTSAAPIVVDGGADSPVELGVKFRSDVNGTITGIRFYKATANTGAHVGNLWTSTGTNLATVTFSNETASGWQQALFATPVTIMSNTVYVASYHANSGHYSADDYYFQGKGMDSPPLHALATGVSGDNGVYVYGASSLFPNQTYNAANYWVDVMFQAGPPTLTSIMVTPTNLTILTGILQQFTAIGTYSDGSTQNITSQATWTSSNTGVATVNASGLATGVSTGTTTISAALGSVSNNTTLTVRALPVILTSTNAVNVPEGDTTNFQVKLNSDPINPTTVTVSRVSGDVDISVQLGTSLVFSASTWNIGQTVTLRAATDADRTNGLATIQCSAPGLVATNVMATELDNTLPVILTSTNAVTVPEGYTVDFQVKLDSAPDNPTTVTVSRVSGDPDIRVQSGTLLVFSVSNWNIDQTVTLFAVADADRINGSAVIQCSSPELTSKEVTATEQDSTLPVILTSTNAVNVPEGGTTDFQVKLDSEPISPTTVTISRVSGDVDISVQSGTLLVFSASTWSIEQTVTLFAATDADRADGSATIQCSAPGLTATNVMATEHDNHWLRTL